MRHIIWVLWPAFIAAGVAETVFFALIDPQQLYFLGQPVTLAAMPTYSIGFFLFWIICSGSSLLSWFMLPQSVKQSLWQLTVESEDLSRRKRNGG